MNIKKSFLGIISNIKEISIQNKKISLSVGGAFVVLIVIAAVYLPGTLFKGALPSNSEQAPIQLIGPLSVGCEVDPATVGTNQNVTLTSVVSGGTKPYSYKWTSPAAVINITNETTPSVVTKYATSGSHEARVYVTDSAVNPVKKWTECPITVVLSINTPPLNLDCVANPSPGAVGEPVTYTMNVSGGNGQYEYLWTDTNPTPDPNLHFKTSQSATTTYDTAGDKANVIASVKDSSNPPKTLIKTCQLHVNEAVVPPLTVACSASQDPATVNEDVTWVASVGGGVPPYSYEWIDMNDPTVDGETTKTVTTSYSVPEASHGVRVIATDSNGTSLGNICTVEVEPVPVQPLSVSCSVSPTNITEGDSVVWSASAQGGAGNYTYLWDGDGVDNATTKTVEATYDQKPQSEFIRVKVFSGSTFKKVICPEITVTPEEDIDEPDIVIDQPITPVEGEKSLCPGVYYPKDIKGHWAESFIKRGYDLCLFKGVNGKFSPDKTATRIEAASMILYARDYQPDTDCFDNDCGTPFIDLENPDQGGILRPLFSEKLIEGYDKYLFKPQFLITRAESASLIVRAFFEPFEKDCADPHCGAGWPDNFFLDIHDTWQGRYIRVLWDKRIMTGSGLNTVEPDRNITRAEMAKMIVLAYEETH